MSILIAFTVPSFSHILKFIAGANKIGTSQIDSVVDTISSATPFAALQRIFAVAGTTIIASSSNERLTCSIPPFGFSGNKLVNTSLFESAASVAIPMNFSADSLIIT